jgi:hypothetical protein
MYAVRSYIIRMLEVYESDSKSFNGLNKFANAYAYAKAGLMFLSEKKPGTKEITELIENTNRINWLLHKSRNKKLYNDTAYIDKMIRQGYSVIYEFLNKTKGIKFETIENYDVDRTHVKGCIATFV